MIIVLREMHWTLRREGARYFRCHQIWLILENVVFSPETRLVDYDDATLTENTRW